LPADAPGGDPVSSALKILSGIEPEIIKPQAPAKNVHQLDLRIAMNMKLEICREIIEVAGIVYG